MKLSKQMLTELYINQNLSSRKIGEMFGLGRKAVEIMIDKNGLPRKTMSEAKRKTSEDKAIGADGYKSARLNGKTLKDHRYVMMLHIGRELTEDEVVHHIDFDRANNDISNLMLLTAEEHRQLHKDINAAYRMNDLVNYYYNGNDMTQINNIFLKLGFKRQTFSKDWEGMTNAWNEFEKITGYNPSKDTTRKLPTEEIFKKFKAYESNTGEPIRKDKVKDICGISYEALWIRFSSASALWEAYDKYKAVV